MKSSSGWDNEFDIFHPTTNLRWLSTQGHDDDLECVSSRVTRRSVDWSLGTRSCVHARRKRAHTGAAHAEAQSQLCTPTRTAFIHKSGENGRASLTSHRAAPCCSPRPAFYERSVRCLSTVHNAHARAVSVPVRDCVLMAAIAIDVRSKFKRTYFPNRGDRAVGAVLLLIYLERASDRATDRRRQNSREWIPRAGRARVAAKERDRVKRENTCFSCC